MFQLHQRRLERLDSHQDFSLELLTTHHLERPLQNVVSELVVNEFLNDKADSFLQIFGLFSVISEVLDDLVIVIWECSFEDLVDVRLLLDIIIRVMTQF